MFCTESAALQGMEAQPVRVEVDVSDGMPMFQIVGMPDQSVREAKDRIRSAIREAGFPFPRTHITVNLAPATMKKQGTYFDLPIALALLGAQGLLAQDALKHHLICGELSLNGEVRGVTGFAPMVLLANQEGKQGVFPFENRHEAWGAKTGHLFVKHLRDVVAHFAGTAPISVFRPTEPACTHQPDIPSLAAVKGQVLAKRALEIAAAGGHHLLLFGPPGTGKTLLAKCLPGLLPETSLAERLELQTINSISGRAKEQCPCCLLRRPFRAPHHSASPAALVGGGNIPQPGEVTLAHHGVLFLDEFPEFSRHTLEHLRQPLEDRTVLIARAQASYTFPAGFQLVAAMNPCPCGFKTHPHTPCRCSPHELQRYQRRISGPLLDRFDLFVHVSPPSQRDLLDALPSAEDPTPMLRNRIMEARRQQWVRGANAGWQKNADIPAKELDRVTPLSTTAEHLFRTSIDRLHLSARSCARIRRVARTIADLAHQETIEEGHLLEALQFRATSSLIT